MAAASRGPRRPFHVMLKPRGAVCDLACSYCYYLAKEALYPGSSSRMPDDILDAFTRRYLTGQDADEIAFGWQGGEPLLMGIDFFRRALAAQERHRPSGVRVLNTLQTNGVGLTDAWCAFLAEHRFLVGISLDGPAALHDAYRVDRGGRPTHERVMRGLALLRRHGVAFNVLTTVHAANAAHPLAVYRFLRDRAGAAFVQFIPVVERLGEGRASDRSVTGPGYGAFLCGVFDEWVRHDVGRVFVQAFDVALAAWTGGPAGLCVHEETCGDALALEHNGDLYACDHFVEPGHRLGNILDTELAALVADGRQRAFGAAKRDTLPATCRSCEVRFACHGGCPKDRFLLTPEGEAGLNWLCEGYRRFFHHVGPAMRWMAAALRHRRPPAGIMRVLAERADPGLVAAYGAPQGSEA
jgi:uncharacterized protein